MKKFILMTVLLAVSTAASAQYRKAIEVKKIETAGETLSDGKVIEADGIHEFTIKANEEADIHLNFLVTQGDLNVLVKSKNEKVVCSKKFDQKSSKMSFTMDEDAEYIVCLSASPNTKYTVSVDQNQ